MLEPIIEFSQKIGIEVVKGESKDMVGSINGAVIDAGVLKYSDGVRYPGDIVYLASSIAICHPACRSKLSTPLTFTDVQLKTAHSMVTAAWCYAACVHLGIPASVCFHEGGYQGQGGWLAQSFEGGQYFGLPFLQLFRMAYDLDAAEAAGVAPYPNMVSWLRADQDHEDISFLPT